MDTSHTPTSKRWMALLFFLLILWGVTDVRHRARLDPAQPHTHRTDLSVFTEAGAAFFDGRDPYEVTNIRGWRYPYPPLFAILLAPLHALPTEGQGMIWFFLSLALVWGGYLECRRLVHLFPGKEKEGSYPAWIGWGALIAVLFPVLDCLQRGQIGVVLIYFLLLGFRLTWESTSWQLAFWGGVLLALPVVFKVVPALPVGFLLFMGVAARIYHNREFKDGPGRVGGALAGVVFGMFLFLWGVPGALVGWQANQDHLLRWYELVGSNAVHIDRNASVGDPHLLRNQSLSNAAFQLGNWVAHVFFGGPPDQPVQLTSDTRMPMDAPAAQSAILVIRLGLLLLLMMLGWSMGRWGDGLGFAALFGMACVAALVVSPLSRGHYFMLQIPALLLVPLWFRRRGQDRTARILVWAPAGLSLLHYALLGYAGRVGLLGIGTALWFALAAWGMMRLLQKERLEPCVRGDVS